MIDSDLKEQLKTVFAPLEKKIEFQYVDNNHKDLPELIQMLEGVASTSTQLSIAKSKETSTSAQSPDFRIYKNNQPTGIVFRGIPNGHEFTSFVLAILNTDGKGKLPDANLTQRIKNIKGPVRVSTYISLTCENCPDVVQALNQMALLHDDFVHEMRDGQYFQKEIDEMGILGVPTVMVDEEMIHSGRGSILDLISKLEDKFGKKEQVIKPTEENLGDFDVVVVGGGPAGASAAIYSARKGLKTAIIAEKIGGQVQETKGIENLISVVYTEGPHLAAQLAKHISTYPIKLLENRRVKSISPKENNKILLESGEYLSSKSIIIATGAKWRELGVPGEKQYLGKGVAFCPHCDGPFYKDKKVAVIGGGNSGVEAAIDLAGIVKEVVLLEFADSLKADQILIDKMNSLKNVTHITSARTTEIVGDGQKVNALKYEDRKTQQIKQIDLDGVFVQIGLLPNSQFIRDVVETTKFGEIVVDNKGRTSTQGIYAAGDVTTIPYKQIIISMGEGAKAALAAFEDRMLKT